MKAQIGLADDILTICDKHNLPTSEFLLILSAVSSSNPIQPNLPLEHPPNKAKGFSKLPHKVRRGMKAVPRRFTKGDDRDEAA